MTPRRGARPEIGPTARADPGAQTMTCDSASVTKTLTRDDITLFAAVYRAWPAGAGCVE